MSDQRITDWEAVLAFARNVGLRLEPWQERTIRAIYSDVITTRARRNGLETVKRAITEYETSTRRGRLADGGECLAHKTLGITPHVCLLPPGHEDNHQWTADRG